MKIRSQVRSKRWLSGKVRRYLRELCKDREDSGLLYRWQVHGDNLCFSQLCQDFIDKALVQAKSDFAELFDFTFDAGNKPSLFALYQ